MRRFQIESPIATLVRACPLPTLARAIIRVVTRQGAFAALPMQARVARLATLLGLVGVLGVAGIATAWAAAVTVSDDSGAAVTLKAPARRVISLSPHATELIYAAGGEHAIVAAVSYSDYPAAARALPRVGDNESLDLEKIAALKPDLLIVWRHGNAQRQVDTLRALGIPMFLSEPRHLSDIDATLRKLGILMGTEPVANQAADAFTTRVTQLRTRYAQRSDVSVFYQIWDNPLMTLNGDPIVNEVIRLCGGHNVFASLAPLAPTVSAEAVIAANPEVIVTGRYGNTPENELPASLDRWKAWPQLSAVSHRNLFAVNADWLDRPTSRIVDGAAQLCADFDTARVHLAR